VGIKNIYKESWLALSAVCILIVTLAVIVFDGISIKDLQLVKPCKHAQDLIEQSKYAEAEAYLNLYLDLPSIQNKDQLGSLLSSVQEERCKASYKLKEVGKGFIFGASDEAYGQLAALASELLLVGDVRDLGRKGGKFLKKEATDSLLSHCHPLVFLHPQLDSDRRHQRQCL
jgi:hypothetical protein